MKTRIEHDLLGEKEVPADAYYGIQTLRGIENFQNISGITIGDYPNYVKALAMVKWAAAKANQELEILPDDIANAITRACEFFQHHYNGHYKPATGICYIREHRNDEKTN